jgi:hypothetical protein
MTWLVVVATTLLLTGCGREETSDRASVTPPSSAAAESSTTRQPTTAPSTTAPMPPCGIEAPGWLPSELPTGTVVLEGSTVTGDLPGDGPAWTTQTLVRVGAGAVIDRHITVYSTSAPSGMAAGGSVVRGHPATVGPGSPSRGGAPVADAVATWEENGRGMSASGFGVSPDTLVADLERMTFVDGFLLDPSRELVELGRVTTPTSRRTYLAVSAEGDDPAMSAAEVWVTDQPGKGEGLPEPYGPLIGSRLTQLAGRTAVVDETGGYGRVLTTTSDGAAVSATGGLTSEELSTLVVSLERVAPDDPRLEVVPRGGPSSPEPVCE